MYSSTVLDHFGNPRNGGKPERFTVRGVAGRPEAGPFMVIYLDIREGRIHRTGFETYGCGPAIAAGSLLSELLKGMTPSEAGRIDSEILLRNLGGLPLGKEHCAHIAVAALADGLRQFEAQGGER